MIANIRSLSNSFNVCSEVTNDTDVNEATELMRRFNVYESYTLLAFINYTGR